MPLFPDKEIAMPHYKTAFPSKFLSASEIDHRYDTTIATADYDDVGTDDKAERKLVATFEEAESKAIVWNFTRCEAIAEVAGTPDYLKWPGTRVNVSQGWTRYAGKKVACIVIGPPDIPPAPPAKRPPVRKPSTEPEPDNP